MALGKGARCKLRGPFGEGPGMLPAGTEGVVTGVFGPDHFRPGEVDQDVVLINMDDPGQPAPRALSLTADRFDALFEVVKGGKRGR